MQAIVRSLPRVATRAAAAYIGRAASTTACVLPSQTIRTMAAATAAEPKTKRRELYPAIEAYNTGMLKVSDVHTIYYEVR